MSSNADRFAEVVRARREELDRSQLDVWQAGGPSNTTLTIIENGNLEKLTRTTARRLDVGLDWEPGSARRVWDGGEPTPAMPGVSGAMSRRLREHIEVAPEIDEETRAELLRVLRERGAS